MAKVAGEHLMTQWAGTSHVDKGIIKQGRELALRQIQEEQECLLQTDLNSSKTQGPVLCLAALAERGHTGQTSPWDPQQPAAAAPILKLECTGRACAWRSICIGLDPGSHLPCITAQSCILSNKQKRCCLCMAGCLTQDPPSVKDLLILISLCQTDGTGQ